MIDVVDGLRELLEPASLDDPLRAESGCAIDNSCAEPFEYAGDTVYAYEDSDVRTLDETYVQTETGSYGVERSTFAVMVIFCGENEGENSELRRDRGVSIKLDERAARYLRAIREHRTRGDLWQHIQGSADADYVRDLGVRGIAIRITGWRFVH